VDRASLTVAAHFRDRVRDGRLQAGDRLPTEQRIGEQFGVSRVTVREALRILEGAGLVQMRVGARAGAYVASPTVRQLGDGFAGLLALAPPAAGQVTEAQAVLDLGILPLVVSRATAEDVADLRARCAVMDDAVRGGADPTELVADFHVRVAECTQNPAVVLLVRSVVASASTGGAPAPLSARRAALAGRLRRRYVDAVEARDLGAARAALEQLVAVRSAVRRGR
jgi:DNA-binding FadR family transcriptional regulator